MFCRRMPEKTWLPDNQTSTLEEKQVVELRTICHKKKLENLALAWRIKCNLIWWQ